jgi:hypothetical protein
MKLPRYITIIAVTSFSLMMIGCAKEPVKEVLAAKAAVDSAKTAQADLYQAGQFALADSSLKSALADIEKQKTVPPFKRKYDKAKSSLISVASLAANLKVKAVEEKARVKADADSGIVKAKTMMEEVKNALKRSAKTKWAKAKAAAARKKLPEIKAAIREAQAAQAIGDFLGAREKINSAIADIRALKIKPVAAVEKTVKVKTRGKVRRHRR